MTKFKTVMMAMWSAFIIVLIMALFGGTVDLMLQLGRGLDAVWYAVSGAVTGVAAIVGFYTVMIKDFEEV